MALAQTSTNWKEKVGLMDFDKEDYFVMKGEDAEFLFFLAFWYYLYQNNSSLDLQTSFAADKTDFFYNSSKGWRVWVDFDMKWDYTISKPSDFDSNDKKIKDWLLKSINWKETYETVKYKQASPWIILKKLVSLSNHNSMIEQLRTIQSESFREELFKYDRTKLYNPVYKHLWKESEKTSLMKILDVSWFAFNHWYGKEIISLCSMIDKTIENRFEWFTSYIYINGFINFKTTWKFKEYLKNINWNGSFKSNPDRKVMDEFIKVWKYYHSCRAQLKINKSVGWKYFYENMNKELFKILVDWFNRNVPMLYEDIFVMAKVFKRNYKNSIEIYNRTKNPLDFKNNIWFWFKYEKTEKESFKDRDFIKHYDSYCLEHNLKSISGDTAKLFYIDFIKRFPNFKRDSISSVKEFRYPINVYIAPDEKTKKEFVKSFKMVK